MKIRIATVTLAVPLGILLGCTSTCAQSSQHGSSSVPQQTSQPSNGSAPLALNGFPALRLGESMEDVRRALPDQTLTTGEVAWPKGLIALTNSRSGLSMTFKENRLISYGFLGMPYSGSFGGLKVGDDASHMADALGLPMPGDQGLSSYVDDKGRTIQIGVRAKDHTIYSITVVAEPGFPKVDFGPPAMFPTVSVSPVPAPRARKYMNLSSCANIPAVTSAMAYPTEALKHGINSGHAEVTFIVKADGQVTNITLVSYSHVLFADAAVAAVKQFKCTGSGIDQTMDWPIDFLAE